MSKQLEPLNDRQRRFCQNIVKGMNNKDAYAAAGYKATGNSQEVNSSKLRKKPLIQAEIERFRAKAVKRAEISQADVLQWLADVMTTPPSEVTADSPLCQEALDDGTCVHIKMVPKVQAVGLLVKTLGMEKATEINIGGLTTLVKKIRSRQTELKG